MTMNRRSFVKNAMRSSVGIAVSSSLPLSLLASSPASAQEDYKAIVCVLLAGGADSFNILVPRSTQAYNQYQSRRSDLALSQSDLLPLDGTHGGVSFGLHPAMSALQSRFNAGQATLVTNIGPLVEPTSREAFEAGSVTLPLVCFLTPIRF